MARKVKEFVQIDTMSSLDDLIEALSAVRDALPHDAEAELSLRGNDVFGRHIAVAFMRPLTEEETACEARYAEICARMIERHRERSANPPVHLRIAA